MLKAVKDGAVELYHDNSKKIHTYSEGCSVFGNLNLEDSTGTSYGRLRLGNSSDLQIYHDGNNSFIKDAGTGRLSIVTSQLQLTNSADSEVMIKATENGPVELYYDGARVFETDSGSVKIRDNIKAIFGTGNDLEIYHDGSNNIIRSVNGYNQHRASAHYLNNADSSNNFIRCETVSSNDLVSLHFNGSKKFETTSDGVEISGGIKDADFLRVGTTSTTGISTSGDDIIIGSIGDSTDRGITFATTASGTIRWADAGDNAMGRIQYLNTTDVMSFHTANAQRIRIDSDGLKFGSDTAAANALDDYEEGTFSFSESNISITNHEAKYTKIGRVVMLSARLTFGSSSNTTTLNMTGLPFTADSGAGNSTCGGVVPEQNLGLGALFMAVEHGNNSVRIRKDSGSVINPANASGKSLRFVLHYIAA